MEKIMSFRKMNVKSETDSEFYLNPRDVYLNGHLNLDLLANSEIFHYLPLNEFFVVLFDEYLAIIDIKESITNSFKIITQINVEKIYENNFPKKSTEAGIKKPPQSNNKKSGNSPNSTLYPSVLNFKSSDDDKKIKNFNVFEIKSVNNSLGFIIEYMNQDFIVFKYDNIRDSNSFSVIYKLYRDEFFKVIETKGSNLTSGNSKNSFCSSGKDTMIRYVEINKNNFEEKNFEDDYNLIDPLPLYNLFDNKIRIHLVLMKINSLICFNTIFIGKEDLLRDNISNTNDEYMSTFSFDFFHQIPSDIINFIAKMFDDILYIVMVNSDYDVLIDCFRIKYNFNNHNDKRNFNLFAFKSEFLFSQKISFKDYSPSVINFFDIDQISQKVSTTQEPEPTQGNCLNVLLISKLNKIYVYIKDVDLSLNLDNSVNSNKFKISHIFDFKEVGMSSINHAFIINSKIFAFNNKGQSACEYFNVFDNLENTQHQVEKDFNSFSNNFDNPELTIKIEENQNKHLNPLVNNKNIIKDCSPQLIQVENSNKNIFTISIVRDIFSIKKFNNDLGFFILGSNSLFKGNEFNICYYLPENLRDNETLNEMPLNELLFFSNLKIYNLLSNKVIENIKKSFFSLCLAEYVAMFYRLGDQLQYNKLLFSIDSLGLGSNFKGSDNVNQYFNLLINRLKIYVSRLKKEYAVSSLSSDLNEENFNVSVANFNDPDNKSYIIHQFRSLISFDSIDDINDYEFEYGEYINNEDYSCEICSEINSVFVKYNEAKRSYTCVKGHLTFSCCITYLPVTEEGNFNFYLCEECNLVYSENKIRICLVCQKSLNLL
jgi:hypothetical protein